MTNENVKVGVTALILISKFSNFQSNKFMQLRTFYFLLLLVLAQQATAQTNTNKRYQGLLWEISGKGTARPSYLYGTMHVPEKLVYNLSDSFFIALRHCDYVSLETDHNVWQEFMQKMKEDNETFGYAENGGFSTRNNYNNYTDLYGQSFKLEAPDTRLFEAMFAYKPVMANEFLYRSNGFGEDFEEDTYLDLFIFQAGKKLGKQVIGLETMDGSYESVTRARIPDDDEKEEYNPYGGKYINPNSIRDAYRKQDLNALDSLNSIMSPGKNFRKWMLEERNIVMANGIDSIAKMGKNMFSAVGAAHLAGDIGVIEQLRNRGYTVRAVQFSFDTDKKNMADIEKIRYPVKLTQQWSNDSVWSAEAPSKFYTTSEAWRIEQSLCADMCNGAYYAVYRLKTNGLWTGQTPEYISTRIDSIIYEKIPGKIQERKRFTSPFPGHDITTKTRRGDIQRYKIMITPSEVIMFIMGGNGDYVSGKEGDQFFNSIQLNPLKSITQEKETLIEPKPGNIKVKFPVSTFINTSTDKKATELYIAGQEKNPDNGYYFLTRVSYHDTEYIEEDTFELNIICEKIAEQFTKTKPTLTPGQIVPYPTQTFSFQSDKDKSYYFGKVVIDGPQYYLMGCRNTTGKSPDAFFNSFELKPSTWPEGWMEKKDTSGEYTVMVPKAEEKQPSQLYQNLKKIGEEIAKKARAKYGDNGDYDFYGKNYSDQIVSQQTGEKVFVNSYPYSSRVFPDKDSLKRSTDTYVSANKQMMIKSSKIEAKGDTMIVMTYEVVDTNSNRGILQKIFLTNKRRYSLMANINTDAPPSAFINKVFETFQPMDTSLRHAIEFGGRDIRFLDNIYAADSLVRKKALSEMRGFNWIEYKKEDFGLLKSLITHPDFDKLKFTDKEYLLASITAGKSPEALPFIKNFYYTHADSARYQSVALKNIPRLRSKEAFKTLFELLLAKRPYMDYSHINAIYYTLQDTLELTRHFVSDLVQLSQREEHTNKVEKLLFEMVSKGLIKPKSYKALKSKLLADQYYALSQSRFNEEVMHDQSYTDYRYGGGGYGGNYNRYNRPYYDENGGYDSEEGANIPLQLLMTFYKEDKEVQALFQEMLAKGNKQIQLDVINLFASAEIPVSSSILEPLSKSDETRFGLYSALVKGGIQDQYKSWFSDSIALVRSYILKGIPAEEIDSVRFISKSKSVIDKKQAFIYFFDVKRKKSKDWVLNYVTLPTDYGLKPAKSKNSDNSLLGGSDNDYYGDLYANGYDPNARLFQVQVEGNLTNDKDKQTFIAKKVGEIRFSGRNRYRSARNSYYDEY